MAHGFGPELFFEGVHSAARHHVTPAQNRRPTSCALRPLVESKAGPTVGPMPAARFLPFRTQGRTLTPVGAFAYVPRVQFADQRERFQRQLELQIHVLLSPTFGPAHLLVQLFALPLGALALLSSRPAQGGGRDFHARQPLDHLFCFSRWHCAARHSGHLLHRRRLSPFFGQTQERVRRKTPLLATSAITAGTLHTNRAKAALNARDMALAQAAEFVLTDRTEGRGRIGLLLS